MSKDKLEVFKPYSLRNNSHCVNLPAEYWKKAGWNINDKVFLEVVTVLDRTLDGKDECDEIIIKRIKDINYHDCDSIEIDPKEVMEKFNIKENNE